MLLSGVSQSFIVTDEAGPFQKMLHRDITSRPMSNPKFGERLTSPFISKPNCPEPIGNLANGASVEPGNAKPIAYVGNSQRPPTVIIGSMPVGVNPICSARPTSIILTLAPVSKCAKITIGKAPFAFSTSMAGEIETGKFRPSPASRAGEEMKVTWVSSDG